MAQYDVDLRDYLRILRKRKALLILMILLAAVSSYGFAKLKEPVPLYEATASVKIRQTAYMVNFLMGGFLNEGENIYTQAAIITSFPVLTQVAKDLRWLPAAISDDEIRRSEIHFAVLERLKDLIRTEQEPGTNIINIYAQSADPNEAAVIANAFAKAFRLYNINENNRQVFETKVFIEEQLQFTHQKLSSAEEALRKFQEATSLIAPDIQTGNQINRMEALELAYADAERQRVRLLTVINEIDDWAETKSEVEGVSLLTEDDAHLTTLHAQLRDLLLERQHLLINFTGSHPEVLEVDGKIEGIYREIKKESVSKYESIARKAKELLVKIDRLRQETQNLPSKALELERLEREVDLQEGLYSQLKTKYQETLIKESGRVEEVSVIRPAMVPGSPINVPSKMMIIITGTVIGIILGIVCTFVVETLDTSIGTIEDIESLLNVPVLGVIPFWGQEDKTHLRWENGEKTRTRDLVTHYDPKSLAAEAFRSLRTNIQFLGLDHKKKCFLITSSFLKEGKTINVVNIALSMAQAGDRVLLVEGDLRKPLVHRMFGIDKAPGLSDYISVSYTHLTLPTN